MAKISSEIYALAKSNGISRSTLSRRVSRGWNSIEAATTPTDPKALKKRQKSSLFRVKRGKLRSFKLPVDLEKQFEEAARQSGITELDYASEIIVNYFKAST